MTAGWCSRTVRAALFAAVCVLLAAVGHVLMSGSDLPAWVLVVALGLTGGLGWCLAARERGLALVVFVAVVAQSLLHTAFSFVQSGAGPATTGPGDPGHTAHGATGGMSDGSALADQVGHMGHSMTGSASLGMFAAHLLAALLSGVWMAFGERAVFRMLRAVAGWLAAPLRLLFGLPVAPRRPYVPPRRPARGRTPRSLLLVHAITSRGPPPGIAVA
ncbi:hypothetical protein ACIQNG_00370 [Streptomyces sp. NPDC091377]|uniref:hypothetical protein n=1 Tax=Streptomyces sp. NPDC091377 TaxID=3365995 RepID=UPI00382CEA1F